jgi:aromatic ring-opening dioxygenase catalytic subunit (LigB family)
MMTDQEIEKLIQDIEDGKAINFNDQFKVLATIYKKMKQLYQQTYNPPTNNDLNKSINDLSSRISILESKIK